MNIQYQYQYLSSTVLVLICKAIKCIVSTRICYPSIYLYAQKGYIYLTKNKVEV